MINEVIRARVAASGFAPEHVDAIAARLTEVAEAATKAACQKYIDASLDVGAGDDYRFGAVLSIALGQPRSETTGRLVRRFTNTNDSRRVSWLDRNDILARFGPLLGLTDDPLVLAQAAGEQYDPFPFRFIDGASEPPGPLDQAAAENQYNDEHQGDGDD